LIVRCGEWRRCGGNVRRAAGERARLSVFRSSKHIYAQVIDDAKGQTLASASSLEKDMRDSLKTGANVEAAKAVGKRLAERASRRG
jgi:large subunit ribosomal protein L18